MFLSQSINITAAGLFLLEIGFAHNIHLTFHVMQVRILFPASGVLRPAKRRVNTQSELIRVSEMPELVSWAGFGEKQVPPQEESADLRCSSQGEMNCCIAAILIWKPQINSNSQQPPGVQLRSGFFENRNRGKRKLSCLSWTSHESPAASNGFDKSGLPTAVIWALFGYKSSSIETQRSWQAIKFLLIGEAPHDAVGTPWALSVWSVGVWVGRVDQAFSCAAGNSAGVAQKEVDSITWRVFPLLWQDKRWLTQRGSGPV